MDRDDRFYHQKYYCDRCNHSDIRKLKINRFFSFLQRFRARDKKLLENATTPSSSSFNRLIIGPGYRWESIESALSSTTATSFAFVSACHLERNSDSSHGDKDETKLSDSFVGYGNNCSYLQKKYNLLGYDATLCDRNRDRQHEVKRLARNSLADPENVDESLLRRFDPHPLISRSVRHCSKSNNEVIPKTYCHRPGKRKAPLPPVANPAIAPSATFKRIHCRKKGRAPLPPGKPNMENVNSESEERRQEVTVHNDSLKLEKGILKANNSQTKTSYRPEFVSTAVSPKHWYKRSATRPSKTVKSLERKASCAELLDEWMLEVGQPRSLSFHEFCRLNYSPSNDNGRRKSPISMLANISELDREAVEILQKERRETEHSLNRKGKKYNQLSLTGRNTEQVFNEIKQNASNSVISGSKEAPIANTDDHISKKSSFKRNCAVESYNTVNNISVRQSADLNCTEFKGGEKEPAKETFSFHPARPFSNWTCPQCTLENPSWKFICDACHKWRPSTVKKMSVSESITNSDRRILWKFDDPFNRKPPSNVKGDSNVEKISKNNDQNQQNRVLESSSCNPCVFQPVGESKDRKILETEVNTNSSFQNRTSLSINVENEEPSKIKQFNFHYDSQRKQHLYTEKDGQKFRKILRELKDLFPEQSFENRRLGKPKTAVTATLSGREGSAGTKMTDELKKDEERKNSKMTNDNRYLENEKMGMPSSATDTEFPNQKLKGNEKDSEKKELTTENRSENGAICKEQTVTTREKEMKFSAAEAGITHSTALEKCDINEKNEKPPDVELVDNFQKSENEKEWICSHCTLINANTKETCDACDQRREDEKNIRNNLEPFYGEAPLMVSHPLFENYVTMFLLVATILLETTKKDLTNYLELVDLEQADLIRNIENFECPICFTTYNSGCGVVLKNCLHTFCRECLGLTIEHNEEVEIKCPYRDADYSCECTLQEREIKALVEPHVYEKYLARSISEAENKIKNAFHCKTANCRGWCIYEDKVNEFHCPVCSKVNCLTCQAIHSGMNCKEYQDVINLESETNADANRTKLMLQEMLQKKDAMVCPTCHVILMKKWGCDWLRCTMCKTEICWVTRGPRWGPKGKGDTSGGCRCGVYGIKCHEKCTFCH